MTTVTCELDIDLWINTKGSVLFYIGDSAKEIGATLLSELIKHSVEAHKVPYSNHLDRDEAKKFAKLKKELVKCLDYINYELDNAK